MSSLYALARTRKIRPGILVFVYVSFAILVLCADWLLFGFQNGYCLYLIVVYGAIFPILLRGPWLAVGLSVLAGIVAAMYGVEHSRFDGSFPMPDPRWFVTDRFIGSVFFFCALTVVISIVMRAYRKSRQRIAALNESLIRTNVDLEHKNEILESTLKELKLLKGVTPVCSRCKKIRDSGGTWTSLESYLQSHPAAETARILCPDCLKEIENKADPG